MHGEDSVVEAFAACLRSEYGYDVYAPYSGTRYDLAENRVDYEAAPIRLKKKSTRSESDVFSRLVAAGQRLLAVIRKNEGVSNKDLAKFADQIGSLADKWDR